MKSRMFQDVMNFRFNEIFNARRRIFAQLSRFLIFGNLSIQQHLCPRIRSYFMFFVSYRSLVGIMVIEIIN